MSYVSICLIHNTIWMCMEYSISFHWLVCIGSEDGLSPAGVKPFLEPMLLKNISPLGVVSPILLGVTPNNHAKTGNVTYFCLFLITEMILLESRIPSRHEVGICGGRILLIILAIMTDASSGFDMLKTWIWLTTRCIQSNIDKSRS